MAGWRGKKGEGRAGLCQATQKGRRGVLARPGAASGRYDPGTVAMGGRWRQRRTLPCCAERKHGRGKAPIGGPGLQCPGLNPFKPVKAIQTLLNLNFKLILI
jgi:hypothetical protein